MKRANNISTFFGNGDGTFSPSVTQVVGYQPYGGIVSGDFNGDGAFDLAVENDGSGTITTLLSQPTATTTATLTGVSPAGTGTHRIQANYAGDTNYSASTSNVVSLTAQGAATSLHLTVSPGSGTYGQAALLAASLSPAASQNRTNAGESVSFSSGGTALGSAVLVNGLASLSVTSLPLGVDSVNATYVGDSYFAASQSNTVSYDATVATTLVLAASTESTTYGQTVVLTATVRPSKSQGKASDGDLVLFYENNFSLGSAPLVAGTATLSVSSLPIGSSALTATFVGDTSFATSASNNLAVNVAPATPTITWAPPASSTYTGTAASTNLFNATSSVPGYFTYTVSYQGKPAVSSVSYPVLQAGTYQLTATVTPYSSSYYLPASVSVNYTVLPSTVTVMPANANRAFGAVNPAVTTTVSGTLNGDTLSAVGASSATTLSPVGTYPITYTLVGANAANYSVSATAVGTLTVTQATPPLVWNSFMSITYGTAVSATQLNAGSLVPGNYSYTPGAGTLLYPGSHTLSVTFTPNDTTDYSSTTATTNLVVAKAPLSLTANNLVRVYGAANPILSGTLSGMVNNDSLTESFQTAATPAVRLVRTRSCLRSAGPMRRTMSCLSAMAP